MKILQARWFCLRDSRTAKLSISGGEKSSSISQTELATKGKEIEGERENDRAGQTESMELFICTELKTDSCHMKTIKLISKCSN